MANRLLNTVWTTALVVNKHSKSLTCLFQLLLMLAVFEPTLLFVAEFALVIALLLATAQIICIFPGSYFYSFPKGMQI
jgi:hypothetical protein